MHDGSGFAMTEAEIRRDGKRRLRRRADLPPGRVPEPRLPRQHGKIRRRDRLPERSDGRWLTRARAGSPGSGSCRASAKGSTRTWQRAERRPAARRCHERSRPTSCIASCRSSFDKQIPKKGDQRQMEPWQRIGTYAAGPRARQRRREGQRRAARTHGHDRRGGRRRARRAGRSRRRWPASPRPESPRRSSTSG